MRSRRWEQEREEMRDADILGAEKQMSTWRALLGAQRKLSLTCRQDTTSSRRRRAPDTAGAEHGETAGRVASRCLNKFLRNTAPHKMLLPPCTESMCAVMRYPSNLREKAFILKCSLQGSKASALTDFYVLT